MKKETKTDRQSMYPPMEDAMNLFDLFPVDPLGSYTGRPADEDELPVQDADDL